MAFEIAELFPVLATEITSEYRDLWLVRIVGNLLVSGVVVDKTRGRLLFNVVVDDMPDGFWATTERLRHVVLIVYRLDLLHGKSFHSSHFFHSMVKTDCTRKAVALLDSLSELYWNLIEYQCFSGNFHRWISDLLDIIDRIPGEIELEIVYFTILQRRFSLHWKSQGWV